MTYKRYPLNILCIFQKFQYLFINNIIVQTGNLPIKFAQQINIDKKLVKHEISRKKSIVHGLFFKFSELKNGLLKYQMNKNELKFFGRTFYL